MRKILFGSAALITLMIAHSAVAIDAECFVQPVGASPIPCPSIAGSPLFEEADNVAGNNTTANITNGTVVAGTFSSGTITNPTLNQVVLGPIDTTGADSFEFTQIVTSGSGALLTVQFSANSTGPWVSALGEINHGVSQNTYVLTMPNTASSTFGGPIAEKYMQIIASVAATEVLSITGNLRSIPFAGTIAAPLVYTGSAAIQLNGSAGNFSAAPVTLSSAKYLVVLPYSIPETTWQYSTAGTPITTAVTTQIVAAGAATVRNYLAALSCDNTVATGGEIQILDGATVIFDAFMQSTGIAGGGDSINITFPIPLRGTAATAMSLKTLATTALYCSAQGYQAY